MTDNFFTLYWCLCVSAPFILLLFHKQTPRNHIVGWKTKKCTLPSPITTFSFIFFSWKCPAEPESAGNGIFETVNLKICLERLRRSNFSSNAYTLQNLTLRPSVGKTEAVHKSCERCSTFTFTLPLFYLRA